MRDDFTQKRLAWLEAVASDSKISLRASRVAVKLATRFLSREKGYAWPSQETLAESLGISIPAVQRALRDLRKEGFLRIEGNRHNREINRYYITFPNEIASKVMPSEVMPSEKEQASEVMSGSHHLCSEVTSDLNGADITSDAQNPLNNPLSNPSENIYAKEFEKFWSIWILKKRKAKAKEEFYSARLRGGADLRLILLGAERYASKMRGKPEGQITWPHSWLYDQAWLNELTPDEIDPDRALKWRLKCFEQTGTWKDAWGPRPDTNRPTWKDDPIYRTVRI